MSLKSVLFAFILQTLAVSTVWGHMKMTNPKARLLNGQVDFDLTSPNNAQNFPCRGAQKAGPSSTTVKAGSSLPVTIDGGAPHGGGHCMFSLSNDGKNWLVIDSITNNCLSGASSGPFNFNVPIPAGVPSGSYVFSWSWIPRLSGQPEYYHNWFVVQDVPIHSVSMPSSRSDIFLISFPHSADVTVTDGGNGITGRQLLVANLNPSMPVLFESTLSQFQSKLDAQPSMSIGAGGQPVAPPAKRPDQTPQTPPPPPPPAQPSPPPANGTPPANIGRGAVDAPAKEPASPPASVEGSCVSGTMKCSGNSKFLICANGKYVTFDTAPGTKCIDADGTIKMDYA
ncbi:hypothetical protein BKA69DRAFT_1094480 [Paraphysoderma sedebokerense]|nr:hypothetical protein BKA69DRAFT_1094480 [Paraphysoderma sedebokerense]